MTARVPSQIRRLRVPLVLLALLPVLWGATAGSAFAGTFGAAESGEAAAPAFHYASFAAQYGSAAARQWEPTARFAGSGPLLFPDHAFLAAADTETGVGTGAAAPFGPTGGDVPPAYARPAPSGLRYTVDLFLAAAATVAWKRALNVTGARRIIVESYEDFGDIISTAPAIDDGNGWKTNWIAHPLLGMYYYQYFRSRGHNRWMSALGSFIESTVHEYVIETSFEPASGIDIILTPGMGVPLGMLTDELSVRWMRSESGVKRFCAYVLNPFLAMPWSKWRRHVGFNPADDRFTFTIGMDY